MSNYEIILQDKPKELLELNMDDILPDYEFNCRQEVIGAETLVGLMESIAEVGLLEPIIVRPIKHPTKKYLIVAGYRRYTAMLHLGKKTINAIVHYDLTMNDAIVLNFVENNERQQLTLMQEANLVKKLLGMGLSSDSIKSKLNVNYNWMRVRTNILALPPEVQTMVAENDLSQSQINELAWSIKCAKENNYDCRESIIRAAAAMRDAKYKQQEKYIAPETFTKPPTPAPVVEKQGDGRVFKTDEAIDAMQAELIRTLDANLGSRALAWVRLIITTEEFLNDVKREAGYLGVKYEPSEQIKAL